MTDDATTSESLRDFLPYLLSVASNAVSNRIAEQYRSRFGLTVNEWRIMAVLGDGGAMTQRELARRTLLDKVAVNRACKTLLSREFVARRDNESDGRSHLLELSKAGNSVRGKIMPLALAIEREMFADFSNQERETLKRLLARTRKCAGNLDLDGIAD